MDGVIAATARPSGELWGDAADTWGFVEAVLWLGRTGVAWRDLPVHLGQWHRGYVRFARWRDKGTWELTTAWLIRNNRKIPHSRQRQRQVAAASGFDQHPGASARHGREKKTANKP
ncbi:transposase [Hymenobacter terricola]|uniref:transposase n=1 Tax=Hymenobacter terricola TaxID=2819236 RepID=UPI001B30B6B7